jgi:glycine oxidase
MNSQQRVTVIGAGVAGLSVALELAERGASVEVVERGCSLGEGACSWYAGGMLAPWCERQNAEPLVLELGQLALDWWPRRFPETVRRGTLVVAAARDASELNSFARATEGYEWIGSDRIAELEPDLAGRFHTALFFRDEAHLDPRRALARLADRLGAAGVPIRFGVEARPAMLEAGRIIDCRGFAARDALRDLRGVRGEMAIVRSSDLALSRPVRLLHPRIPLYIVPRVDGLFMIGATMIESAARGPVKLRSVVELLSGAYALHPAFGEADVVELGADVRPAFPDNLPRLIERGQTIYLNGLYRHGFLLAPAMAREAAEAVFTRRKEENNADRRERQPM